MLATVGWSFPKVVGTFDGPVDTTDPIGAIGASDLQWWAQFVVFCAVIEGIKFRGEAEGKSYTGEVDKDAALDWSGNWSKLLVVKVNEEFQVSGRMIDRRQLPKKNGKLLRVKWSDLSPG